MAINSSIPCPSFTFIWPISIKPTLFKPSNGIKVKELDDIHDKKLTKRQGNMRYNVHHKVNMETRCISGFKIDSRDRLLLLFAYCLFA